MAGNADRVTIDYASITETLQRIRVCALVTTGRTGSDYLQGLFESHPQVMTISRATWFYGMFWLPCGQSSKALDVLVDEYIARNRQRLDTSLDTVERGDRLGPEANQSVRLDVATFRSHVLALMNGVDVTSRNFLLAVHAAYQMCLGRDPRRARALLINTHNFVESELLRRDFPDARLLVTIRDPRANMFSSVRNKWAYDAARYKNGRTLYMYYSMIIADAEPGLAMGYPGAVVRLEDLPQEPALRAVSEWMGIDWDPAFPFRPTWGGLVWWGDAVSSKSYDPDDRRANRSYNGWREGMWRTDRFVLDYVLNTRLHADGYEATRLRWWHHLVAIPLMCLPTQYEWQLFAPSNWIWQGRHGFRRWRGCLENVAFYFLRAGLFLKTSVRANHGQTSMARQRLAA